MVKSTAVKSKQTAFARALHVDELPTRYIIGAAELQFAGANQRRFLLNEPNARGACGTRARVSRARKRKGFGKEKREREKGTNRKGPSN